MRAARPITSTAPIRPPKAGRYVVPGAVFALLFVSILLLLVRFWPQNAPVVEVQPTVQPAVQAQPTALPGNLYSPKTYLDGSENNALVAEFVHPYANTNFTFSSVIFSPDGTTPITDAKVVIEVLSSTGGTMSQFGQTTQMVAGAFIETFTDNNGRFQALFNVSPGSHSLRYVLDGNNKFNFGFQTRATVANAVVDEGAGTTSDVARQAQPGTPLDQALRQTAQQMPGGPFIIDVTTCDWVQIDSPGFYMWAYVNGRFVKGDYVEPGKKVYIARCQYTRADGVVDLIDIPINPDCLNPQAVVVPPPGRDIPTATPGRYLPSPTPRVGIPGRTATPVPPTVPPALVPSATPTPPGGVPVLTPTQPPFVPQSVTGNLTTWKRHIAFRGDLGRTEGGVSLSVLDANCGALIQGPRVGGVVVFTLDPATYCVRAEFAKEKGDPILTRGQTSALINGGSIWRIEERGVVVVAGGNPQIDFTNITPPPPTEAPIGPLAPGDTATPTSAPPPPPVVTATPTATTAPPPPPVISPTPMPATPTFTFVLATIAPPTATPGPSSTPCCPATPQFSPAPSFTPGPPPTPIWTPEPTPIRPAAPPTPPPTTPTMVPPPVAPSSTPAPAATAGPAPTNTPFA